MLTNRLNGNVNANNKYEKPIRINPQQSKPSSVLSLASLYCSVIKIQLFH